MAYHGLQLAGNNWRFVPASHLRRVGAARSRRADVVHKFEEEGLSYNPMKSVGKSWLVFDLSGVYKVPTTGAEYPYDSVTVKYPDKDPGGYEVVFYNRFQEQFSDDFETIETTIEMLKQLKRE